MRPYRLAVTGSIACGKSHACGCFAELARRADVSLTVVDLDALRAELLESPGRPDFRRVQDQLVSYLGREVAAANGGINRRRLGDIVYYDAEAMALCNGIVEPVLLQEAERRLSKAEGLALLEWALILERRLLHLTDYNVCIIECSREQQLARLAGSDLDPRQIQRRIALQIAGRAKAQAARSIQRQAGRGDLYLIETENNPGLAAYAAVFEQICARAGYQKQGAA